MDDRLVATVPGQGSGMSVAISDASGDYGAVIVSGANLLIDPARLEEAAPWEGVAWLVLQNEVPEALNLAAARAARAREVRVCLNAAPFRPLPPGLAEAVDLLVVNALEAEAMSGVAVADLRGAEAAARSLAASFPVVVVTAGGDGAALALSGGESFARPAEKVALVSTHGAGDVFTGALVAALIGGGTIRDAIGAASQAAARHVAGQG